MNVLATQTYLGQRWTGMKLFPVVYTTEWSVADLACTATYAWSMALRYRAVCESIGSRHHHYDCCNKIGSDARLLLLLLLLC